MEKRGKRITLRDSTMREGLDVPGVSLTPAQKRELIRGLDEVAVPEVELVAPGHFWKDLASLKELGVGELDILATGLIYAPGDECLRQIRESSRALDRVDLLMPLASARPPRAREDKARCLGDALRAALEERDKVGVGFPHATQVEAEYVVELCRETVGTGADRVTLYDTNGSADPFQVAELVRKVRDVTGAQICFHAHNDLGMAAANAFAAVCAGADCLDVTVNGMGDRAGNASLEQVALSLHVKGMVHGLRLELLRGLSREVAAMTRVPVPKLAPVVGEFAFHHKSPSHLTDPGLFEAFDPQLVGAARSLCVD